MQTLIRLLLQEQSYLGLHCLHNPFCQKFCVQNFREFTVPITFMHPKHVFMDEIANMSAGPFYYLMMCKSQGPVVQSVVSLTSSLRVISLTVLADSIYIILIFFAEKM